MNQPLDFLARHAALDPARSFAVSAPAGSGKTGLLTQRLLKLLSLCENPEEVLAITFTRKAAGEMQDRVLQALWKAKKEPQPTNSHDLLTWQLANNLLAHDNEKGWNLLRCPQRLRIQTIDSLCSAIARQLPIASGFGSQPKPGDDTEASYRQAVHQLLNELESETSVQGDLRRLLEHLDNNLPALENLLVALLAKRDQWLSLVFQAQHKNARYYLENVLQEVILDSLAATRDVLLLNGSEIASIADWAAANLQADSSTSHIAKLHGVTGLPNVALSDLEQWIAIAELLLTGEGTFRKALNKNQGFPNAKENKDSTAYKNRFSAMVSAIEELNPDAAETIHNLRSLPPLTYDEQQWELLDSLTRLLPRLAALLDIIFAQSGETDFTAVSQAALTALGFEDSPSDIALQLDYRIRHILVDEFQDTASTQLELLQKLTAGWQAGDGRSLFIVGDGMQSCYSFRNANVGIFLEARAQGIGHLPLEKLDLTVNFRSQSGIVNWVNQQFTAAFPAEDDVSRGAVKYSSSHAFKPEMEGSAVELYVSSFVKSEAKSHESKEDEEETHSEDRYLAELQEAESVAVLIQELRQKNPQDTVALLARSRNHLQHIFPAMARLGLSWQATDIDNLAQRMSIIDLTSLTRALLNPADRIAWLAILRAPWCGLNLNDLHALVNTRLEEDNPILKPNDFPFIWQQAQCYEKVERLSYAGRQSLKRFVETMQTALATRQRKSLRQWVEGIWLALGGPATLLDPQDLKDTPRFFALLEQHQQGGYIKDWNKFIRAVEKLYAAPRQNADAYLQVMTMHKSKGLEFDHVVIPRLHKTSPSDGQQLLLWRERLNKHGERQLLLGPLAPIGGDKDKLYKYIQKESAAQLEYESTRLFYVGCTRAIKKLYLFATLAKNEEGIWKNPPKKSFLHTIWPNVQDEIKFVSPAHITHSCSKITSGDKGQAYERPGLQQLIRLKPDWHSPILEDNQLLKKYRGNEFGGDENIPELETRSAKLARHTGTLIHRALQNLVGVKPNFLFEEWVEIQEPFWQIQLAQYGWKAEEITLAKTKIIRALANTLADERGLWLLNADHANSACELAITHSQGNQIDLKLRENIIDRTFSEKGVRWIIDYKSSEPSTTQTISDFITQETQAYREQLLRYKACFDALGEQDIKLGLYFPLLETADRFVEVEVEV